jgi:hypothetical protein
MLAVVVDQEVKTPLEPEGLVVVVVVEQEQLDRIMLLLEQQTLAEGVALLAIQQAQN